ncbi:MAG: HEAT repeat domain-containing protein [Acidobacteriota bacterium]|nr:HEAT repeat domain-containing protein [Acidobacteriota bacterium]
MAARFGLLSRWVAGIGIVLATTASMPATGRGSASAGGDEGRSSFEPWLSQIGLPSDPPALMRLVVDGANPEVRGRAALALGYLPRQASGEILLEVARADPAQWVRRQAWLALARQGDPDAQAPLAAILEREDSLIGAVFFAGELAEVGDPQGFRVVAQAAASALPYERAFAAGELCGFLPLRRDPRVEGDPIALLARLSADPEARVRAQALMGLSCVVRSGERSSQVATAIALRLEHESDPVVRDLALLVQLDSAKPPAASPPRGSPER